MFGQQSSGYDGWENMELEALDAAEKPTSRYVLYVGKPQVAQSKTTYYGSWTIPPPSLHAKAKLQATSAFPIFVSTAIPTTRQVPRNPFRTRGHMLSCPMPKGAPHALSILHVAI